MASILDTLGNKLGWQMGLQAGVPSQAQAYIPELGLDPTGTPYRSNVNVSDYPVRSMADSMQMGKGIGGSNVTTPANNGGGMPELFQPGLMPFSISGTDTSFGAPYLQQGGNFLSQAGSMFDNAAGFANNWKPLPTNFSSLMSKAAPGAMQQVLNSMAGRRMLNSSVASDTMSKALSELGTNVMGMANQNMQLNQQAVPTMMGAFGNLIGQNANLAGQGANLAGQGANLGKFSVQANPLAPYEMISNFALNF